MPEIAAENDVNLNYGTVEAEFKGFEFDENHNITGATVLCNRNCQMRAYEVNRITADIIARAVMTINIRQRQRQAATVLVVEAAVIFTDIQFALYSTESYLL